MTLRGLWAGAVLVVTTATCALGAALCTTLRPGSDATMIAAGIWSRLNIRAVGARVSWQRLDTAFERLPCIFVANHQSNIDIWALIAVLPKQTRFVAKQTLFRVPVLGWALRISDFIPIDRANRARAIRSLDEAADKIRGGRPVVLFAEGTRTAGDTLGPFKKGPFHLALAAGVPIVPVAISGSGAVLPPGGLDAHPGPVRVVFCAAVDVEPYQATKNVGGLLAAVRAAIETELPHGAAEN